MDVLLVQAAITPGHNTLKRDERVLNLCERIDNTLSRQSATPSLVVLPELCTLEYSRAAFDNLGAVAEPVEGFSFNRFAALAAKHQVAISFSLPICENNRYFISNLVVGANGKILNRYDKVHLAQLGASHEKRYFTAGNRFGTFILDGFRFGILLCYDFRFPAFVQTFVTRYDLDMILHPVAFTRDETFQSWHHFAVTRALENQVYFLSLNRAGEAWGNSIVCPPWVDGDCVPDVFGSDEEMRLITLDRELINSVRATIPLRQDRLSDYSGII